MTRSVLGLGLGPIPQPDQALTGERLAALRHMLEQQRSFRIDQLADLADLADVDQLRMIEAQSPPRGVDREINESLRTGADAALRDVSEALGRMESGRYGSCCDCRRPIELERLEILPQVRLCLPCQRAAAA